MTLSVALPFVAAQEMCNSLRNGGYVYGECNFVFPYHGYPHHYFNATQQGLEEIFRTFTCLRSRVAPYQMPSFAIQAMLETYRREPDQKALTWALQERGHRCFILAGSNQQARESVLATTGEYARERWRRYIESSGQDFVARGRTDRIL